MGSPTTRSLAYLRKKGHLAAVVEKSIPWPRPRGTKIDLFGFADLISIDPDSTTLTQTTSRDNLHSRIKKSLANPHLRKWLITGSRRRFEVHGWGKAGARGKRKFWTLTRMVVLSFEGQFQVNEEEP